MVKGLDVFKDHFKGHEGNYVIIGGTACNAYEELMQQEPRATKDIDLILIVEALTDSFVERFWQFIIEGKYNQRERGESDMKNNPGRKHEFYRFLKPAEKSFPMQIELFSRNLGLMNFPSDAHITPIPVGEGLYSLSAILLDDDYYSFTIEQSELVDGVHYATPYSLICLKAKAFLDMAKRRANGENVDNTDIEKHKKDVFRMAALIDSGSKVILPDQISFDIKEFIQQVSKELPGKELFKAIGSPELKAELLLEQIREVFVLDS